MTGSSVPDAATWLLSSVTLVQAILGARVAGRFWRTAGGERIRAGAPLTGGDGQVSVVVPVLDERCRLAPCLDGLIAQGPEVGEILVVDGGSSDGTQDLVAGYRTRDARIRLVDAGPVPAGWNGKAWGLQVGLQRASAQAIWLLALDADVRPAAVLARFLVAHALRRGVAALSVATLQQLSGPAEALVHPAFLTTLVYRFGAPGHAAERVEEVQANGQCFLFRRDVLERCDGFAPARASRCEDVTIARHLVAAGHSVGFFETDGLVSTRMFASWREAWDNWPRSLPLLDQFGRARSVVGLLEVTFVQALPMPLVALLWPARRWAWWALALNLGLGLVRLGVLAGTARAYLERPWSYWLSPMCDIPVAIQLWSSLARRRHVWRGRVLVDGGC